MVNKKAETALQVYVNEQFGKIRAMLIDGVPYFVGKDVAVALGYSNPQKAIRDHVDDEDKRTERIVHPLGGAQNTVLINESGLYTLALKSQLESAKPFRRWVTSEVLPSIRETGAYVNPNFNDKRWVETRAHGKKSRKKETQVIKLFIEYARSQGCTWKDKKFYSQLSIWANDAAGIRLKNGRDEASVQALNIIDLIEDRLIQDELLNGMANQLHYTEIWAKIQLRIKAFVAITHQTSPLLNGT